MPVVLDTALVDAFASGGEVQSALAMLYCKNWEDEDPEWLLFVNGGRD
ncbi:MAG: hypothetical protein JXR96_18770 [Deltaproteobacteria bacterium]|nr:hypothetical protein [Deltaproteobacteria bacterium]